MFFIYQQNKCRYGGMEMTWTQFPLGTAWYFSVDGFVRFFSYPTLLHETGTSQTILNRVCAHSSSSTPLHEYHVLVGSIIVSTAALLVRFLANFQAREKIRSTHSVVEETKGSKASPRH